MNQIPKKHRKQKYENPPITTTEGFAHRGSSPSTRIHDEFNYSPLAFGDVIRILDCLLELESTQQDTLGSDSGYSQPRVWDSLVLQKTKATKAETTKTTKLQYPHASTSLATTTSTGTTR